MEMVERACLHALNEQILLVIRDYTYGPRPRIPLYPSPVALLPGALMNAWEGKEKLPKVTAPR